MSPTRRRVVRWGICACLVAAVVVVMVNPVMFPRRGQFSSQVRALFDALQLDMSREQVWRVMNSGSYPDVGFRAGDHATWLASAPDEFDAQRWVLVIEFQDERVAALRIRTHDDFNNFQRTPDAPADKVRRSVGR